MMSPPHLRGRVEIICGPPAKWVLPRRLSAGLGICVKDGASHEVDVNGCKAFFPAESVAIHAPGCIWGSFDGVHGFLSIEIVPELLPESEMEPTMAFAPRRSVPGLRGIVERLRAADSALEAEQIVTGLVGSLVETGAMRCEIPDESGGRRIIKDAREYLEANIAGRPTLDDTAEAAGINKYALLRRFRSALGTTPHAYLVLVRLARARELLARGAAPVDVAYETGFADQAHLGRWFRRVFGTTPVAYASEVRFTQAMPRGLQDASPVGDGSRPRSSQGSAHGDGSPTDGTAT